jgi:hypothetical protein
MENEINIVSLNTVSLNIKNMIEKKLNLLKYQMCFDYKIEVDDADKVFNQLINK